MKDQKTVWATGGKIQMLNVGLRPCFEEWVRGSLAPEKNVKGNLGPVGQGIEKVG